MMSLEMFSVIITVHISYAYGLDTIDKKVQFSSCVLMYNHIGAPTRENLSSGFLKKRVSVATETRYKIKIKLVENLYMILLN